MGAYLDKNATEAKSRGNALSAVAAKRLKYATHDKCCGNTQWLLNTKNTYRMLGGGEMRSGCQTRYKRNGSLLLEKYAVAVNANNTQRMLIAGEMRSGCLTL